MIWLVVCAVILGLLGWWTYVEANKMGDGGLGLAIIFWLLIAAAGLFLIIYSLGLIYLTPPMESN